MVDKNKEIEINNLENILKELKILSNDRIISASDEIREIEDKILKLQKEINQNLSAWDKLMIARAPNRPTALDYIENIFDEFIELHGDRNFRDDKSIVCGIGRLDNLNLTIIAQQKGRNTKENIDRNFGMPNPEAYRKSLRFMKQAEKFNRPIITFIDTKGAYPGIGAEERGQGEAIARNMFEMSKLKVPILVIVIGEGSSGGALALGVGDKVMMLENSVYSILSPEGYASILWKDSSKAVEAAEVMKLTAKDLFEFNVIDKVVKEPFGGAQKNVEAISNTIKDDIKSYISELLKIDCDTLLNLRYKKFRNIGEYIKEDV